MTLSPITMPPPINVALIGVTGYAMLYVDRLLKYHREGVVRICAATVINQDAAIEQCLTLNQIGCRIYDNVNAMFESEAGRIDLCCIPTSIHLHAGMTIAALEAGMHVLVEKPLTASLEEAQRMLEARDASDRQVYVGFQNMFMKNLWEAKARLLRGEFGRIQTIKTIALWPRPTTYYTRNSWAGKLTVDKHAVLDSPVNNAMAHFVMMPLFLSGKSHHATDTIRQLHAETYRVQAIESFDTFSARILTENDVELIFNFSHSIQQLHRPTIEILCEDGSLQWFENENYRCPSDKVYAVDARSEMFDNIFMQLNGRAGVCCTIDHAVAHTQFVHAIHQSLDIIDIPAESTAIEIRANSTYKYVRGLDKRLLQAHAQGCTLSQTDSSGKRQPLKETVTVP